MSHVERCVVLHSTKTQRIFLSRYCLLRSARLAGKELSATEKAALAEEKAERYESEGKFSDEKFNEIVSPTSSE